MGLDTPRRIVVSKWSAGVPATRGWERTAASTNHGSKTLALQTFEIFPRSIRQRINLHPAAFAA
jgi:hypothetical protein